MMPWRDQVRLLYRLAILLGTAAAAGVLEPTLMMLALLLARPVEVREE